jgi:alanine-synthesizing transaminase
MWVLLDHDDAAIVPSPSYPIHIYGPLFAGADLRQVPMKFLADPDQREHFADDFMDSLQTAWDVGWPKPRVLVISFPHNPTGACVDLAFMQRVVDFCREHEMIVVHDFAYADVGFDGHQPPSILQAEGAKECAVELYSMTKSFSMAGMAQRLPARQRRGGPGARQAEELPRLRHVPAGADRATVTINEAPDFPDQVRAIYESRCDALIEGLGAHRVGHPEARRVDVRLGADPRAVRRDGFGRVLLADRARRRRRAVARCRLRSRWRGFVRFALIENEKRIQQAIRNLKRGLPKLG